MPTLSADMAAALSAAFLRDTTETIALASRLAPVDAFVAFAPAGLEALFEGHLAEYTRLILADGLGEMPAGMAGFGRCLFGAMRGLLEQGYASVCLLGSDSPTLPTEHLVRAAAILSRPGDRAVLGAVEDGGYYLLGLKHPHPALFSDIAWSTSDVAAQTRAQAVSIGLDLVELPIWHDVDDPASLQRLLHALDGPGPGFHAPATRLAIERLGIRARLSASA